VQLHPGISVPLVHFHFGTPVSPALLVHCTPERYDCTPILAPRKCTYAIRILHPGNTRPASAPQRIRQTALVGHSVPLVQINVPQVQISVPRVQISIPQVQLHPGTSLPPSDAARKCDTVQCYIFKFLNMLTTKKINKPNAVISRTLLYIYPTKPSAAFPNLLSIR
jgi:hypothetical protein